MNTCLPIPLNSQHVLDLGFQLWQVMQSVAQDGFSYRIVDADIAVTSLTLPYRLARASWWHGIDGKGETAGDQLRVARLRLAATAPTALDFSAPASLWRSEISYII